MPIVSGTGETKLTPAGIRKQFKNTAPIEALSELIWNGFDARARTVAVRCTRNPLGALDTVVVTDDGHGIDYQRLDDLFGRFDDSEKKGLIDQRGNDGRGRLAFHRLAHRSRWHTRITGGGEATITIESSALRDYRWDVLDGQDSHGQVATDSGTTVVLDNIDNDSLVDAECVEHLSHEFGWYLALNKTKALLFNGTPVPVPPHEYLERDIQGRSSIYKVRVLRWDAKPKWEKSYIYVMGENGKTVHRELSKLNNKPDFFISLNLETLWPADFSVTPDLHSSDESVAASQEWPSLLRELHALARDIYEDFLKRHVDIQIAQYEADGIFPDYHDAPEQAAWRLSNTKELVRSVMTADPTVLKSLNKKQKKVLVRLLDRLSVSSENHSLFEVLNGVLDLDESSTQRLAAQLQRTTLANVVNTIELIQKRQTVVEQLRELMNLHYKDVLETPDLQQIIENNTWLFGPQYETLGAEETTFSSIAQALRNSIKGIQDVDADDVDEPADIEGAMRQPDLFLARRLPVLGSFGNRFYRCVIVEIKRPSLSLNIKHYRQLEDYSGIIRRHPEFSSELMRFELLLVGRKISKDDVQLQEKFVEDRAHQETGLVSTSRGMRRYVLNWYTLLDGFELSHSHLLETLKLKRDRLTSLGKDELVAALQQPVSA